MAGAATSTAVLHSKDRLPTADAHRTRNVRRGASLVYCAVLIPVVTLFLSFAVDFGVFILAQCRLQQAADAAAHSGACQLADGKAFLLEADVARVLDGLSGSRPFGVTGQLRYRVGFWSEDNRTFSPTGVGLPDAVEVRLDRDDASGCGVELPFLGQFGRPPCSVSAKAVARIRRPTSNQSFIGVDRVRFGSLGALSEMYGPIASNGPIDIGMPLGLFVRAQSDVRSFNGPVRKGPLAYIGGSTRALDEPLLCPSVTAPGGNDNDRIASYLSAGKDFTAVVGGRVPAGTYVVNDLNLLANVALRLDGPVTFYVAGDFNVAAAVNLLGNTSFDPDKFRVRVLPGGRVNFLAPVLSPMSMDLYAPDSMININVGVSSFRGRLVGKELNINLPVIGSFQEGGGTLVDPLGAAARVAIVD